jgi:hypothetical protein
MALYDKDKNKTTKSTGLKTTSIGSEKRVQSTSSTYTKKKEPVARLMMVKTEKPMTPRLVRDVQYKPSGTVPKKQADISPLLKKSVLKLPRLI